MKAGWPLGVRPITMDEIDGLGIDEENQLYWHGRPIEIRRRLSLRWWQTAIAVLAALGAAASGFVAVAVWLGWNPGGFP